MERVQGGYGGALPTPTESQDAAGEVGLPYEHVSVSSPILCLFIPVTESRPSRHKGSLSPSF